MPAGPVAVGNRSRFKRGPSGPWAEAQGRGDYGFRGFDPGYKIKIPRVGRGLYAVGFGYLLFK